MRKLTVYVFTLCVFATVAAAQTHFDMKWHCEKPSGQQYDIGDAPGHSYGLAQGKCNAAASQTGERTGVFTEFQEISKESFTSRGRMIVTMDDGEKTFYSYEATAGPDPKTVAEKWKLIGGTGKHKSKKGSGTCTGTLKDDGTSDWVCSGKIAAGLSTAPHS